MQLRYVDNDLGEICEEQVIVKGIYQKGESLLLEVSKLSGKPDPFVPLKRVLKVTSKDAIITDRNLIKDHLIRSFEIKDFSIYEEKTKSYSLSNYFESIGPKDLVGRSVFVMGKSAKTTKEMVMKELLSMGAKEAWNLNEHVDIIIILGDGPESMKEAKSKRLAFILDLKRSGSGIKIVNEMGLRKIFA